MPTVAERPVRLHVEVDDFCYALWWCTAAARQAAGLPTLIHEHMVNAGHWLPANA
jgi:hypothetical protein